MGLDSLKCENAGTVRHRDADQDSTGRSGLLPQSDHEPG
jgi:hypothetical protein